MRVAGFKFGRAGGGKPRALGGATDTTAPIITSSSAHSVNENSPYAATATANEAVTWTKSGADAGLVTLNPVTGAWSVAAQDYDQPKTLVSFALTATDTAGNASAPQTIALTIVNLNDTNPNAFALAAASDVATGSTQTSNTITIAGLGASDSVTAAVSGAAGSLLSKNGGAFVAGPVTVVNGDTLAVRHSASGNGGTAVSTTLSAGSTTSTFTSTTAAAGSLIAVYRDPFDTGAGALNGRVYKGSTWITALDNTHGGNNAYSVNQPQVVITGKGGVKGGSTFGNKSHAYATPITDAYDFYIAKAADSAGCYGSFHQQLDPNAQTTGTATTPFGGFTYGFAVNAAFGQMLGATKPDGSSFGTAANLASRDFSRAGDALEPRTYNEGGTDYLEIQHNGRIIGATGTAGLAAYYANGRYNLTAMVAAGMSPLSGKHGPAGIGTGTVDWIERGPATRARLINRTFGRVSQLSADGKMRFRGFASWTQATPVSANLRVDIRLASDNSLIGAAGQVPTSVTIDSTTKTIIYEVPEFTPTAAFFVQLYEAVGVTGADGQPNERRCDTPYIQPGRIVLSGGQSNMGNADAAVFGAALSLPAENWSASPASVSSVLTGLENLSQGPMTTGALAGSSNAVTAQYLSIASPALGGGAAAYISGPVGGTSAAQRKPGGSTQTIEFLTDVILKSGGRIDHMRWADGESDMSNPTYKADVYASFDAWSALCGYTVPIMMEALGSYPNGGDVPNENMRRMQMFTMPNERPAQIIPAAFITDGQHDAIGGAYRYLHYSLATYAERTRRSAMALLKFRGLAVNDRLGPVPVSARRIDARHVGVTFAMGAFTTMAASAGMSYVTGKTDVFGGGVRFGTVIGTPSGASSATITGGKLVPSAMPVFGAVSGGLCEVIFEFAADLPATIYVTGPYGEEPFNPDFLGPVGIDYANKTSMILGQVAGEPSVPIRPYWHASGNDYLVAV